MKTSAAFKFSALATAIALTACGGDDSSSKPSGLSSNSEGTAVISAKGANGTLGGGQGGYVDIEKYYSAGELNITLKGEPDTDYELPDFTPSLGANGASITSDTVIKHYESGDVLAVGDLYISNQAIYKYDGDEIDSAPVTGKPSTVITGIEISADATLTLESNDSYLYLYLANDIINNGTITTANKLEPEETDSDSRPHLYLYSFGYTGSGTVEMGGTNEDYPDGRTFRLYATYISNTGNMDASGLNIETTGAEGVAGDGGRIDLNSDFFIENSGALTALGGNHNDGYGGEGGDVDLEAETILVNTGLISINGGSGKNIDSNYYTNSSVYLYSPQVLINTGTITAIGASAISGTDVDGAEGGVGGSVYLELEPVYNYQAPLKDPRIINTGSIDVSGGANFGDYAGGEGGSISIQVTESEYGGEGQSYPAVTAISGDLIANGYGSSETTYGGDGGSIYIEHESIASSELSTQIVGYQFIDVSGGSGFEMGGYAGGIDISSYSNEEDDYSFTYAPASPINIATNFIATGGDAVFDQALDEAEGGEGGYGMPGGYIYITTWAAQPTLQKEIEDASIKFEGNVTINGGSALGYADAASGASGGEFYTSATHKIELDGSINSNGGSAPATGRDLTTTNENGATSFYGAEGGGVYVSASDGEANVDMDININAGTGANYAERAGNIWIGSTEKATLKGNISAIGGSADATLVDSIGGNGGQIYLYSATEKYSSTEDVVLTGGTGNSVGFEGGLREGLECKIGNCIDSGNIID